MAASSINITFTEDLPVGAQLGFNVVNSGGFSSPIAFSLIWDWVNLRSAPYQVTQISPIINQDPEFPFGDLSQAGPGILTRTNFIDAFNLDTSGQYIVTRIGNLVTILSENLFGLTVFSVGGLLAEYTNHPSLIFEINNASTASVINITNVAFSQASALPCQNVRLAITTDNLALKIISPVVINANVQNPVFFNWIRGVSVNVTVENAEGVQSSQIIQTPSLLNALNFNTLINNGPTGATVIVSNTNTNLLTLQYSLDNLIWQNSDTFSGLAVGDYSLYVRDQFGCSINKSFTINEFGIQSPYFYISKSNSIRFANRITFGDSENYKNDENTLSFEVDVQLAYKEFQQFQSADIITTQFRSNYASNIATVIKDDLTEVNIPIIKKTNNIGIKDKRDARKYNLGNGKSGLYFIAGNIYNYITNAITIPYALNGSLPEWAQSGNYFQISNAWYLIEDVIFDETKNADVIVFSNSHVGAEVSVIVGSIYNRFNYEVYEFAIDMVNYINEKIKVRLVNSNVNFATITHLSEVIWCKIKHQNVLEIRYRNTTNTDILYSTGIEHKIRIPYLKISGKSDDQSEVHKTDTDAILLNADLYEVDDFQFDPVTKEIWRKIMIALSHEKVLLNGVGYVKNGNFNTEGPLEKSNLYVLTASMIKTGSVYNSQTSGNIDFDGTETEIPGLISTENGYVKY